MDGSNSRKSDAAATRKRRSSILKSQRPPRTPFSELEFNVATPTDAKSRRVSFSRRNGVAEFEITEATTAWKNVYEEHNKSLESSVNDSKGDKKPLVGHLSSRIAGLQFEDAEADLINTSGAHDLAASFSAGPRDYTGDDKSLSAPHRNFELSEFTTHHTDQLFDDDANPIMKEMTDQIDLNFSAFAPLAEFDQDPDQDKKEDMSYIGLDLNATHFSLKADESAVSDMSITDTIHSPKVASAQIKSEEKDNWVADKENIVVNPYVAPLPAENFAVTDDCDDVLVFDGKKCTFQSDLKIKDLPDQVNVPDPVTTDKRRTIVYNDDAGDISVTQAVVAQIILPTRELNSSSRKMIDTIYGNESNISMTQVVPTNVIISDQQEIKEDKQETTYFNDLSMTQAVPSIILGVKNEERSKTIVYPNDEGHVSMTEAVPANIIISESAERRKTIVYQNEEGDISLTQAVPINILQENNRVPDERKTEAEACAADAAELEMTQAVPVNVLLVNDSEKRKTILFENDDGNMSVTQAVPAHSMKQDDTNPDIIRDKITCENNADNIPFPVDGRHDLSLEELQERVKEIQESIVADVTRLCSEALSNNHNATEAIGKRRTIVFNNDQGNVSITQTLPANILDPLPPVIDKKKSIIYEGTAADISITQAVPVDLLIKSSIESNRNLRNENAPDFSDTLPAVAAEKVVNKTVLHEDEPRSPQTRLSPIGIRVDDSVAATVHKEFHDHVDKSITQAASNVSNKNITISKDDSCNVLVTNPIPAQMISIENDLADKTKTDKLEVVQNEMYTTTFDLSVPGPQNVIVYEAAIKLDKTNEEVSERTPAEAVSNHILKTPFSRADTELETSPEPIEEDGNISSSAESIVDVHGDTFMKHESEQVKKSENPVIAQTSILNDLLDMSNASMDGEQAGEKATMKTGSDPSSANVSVANNASNESYLIIKDSDSPIDVRTSETRKSLVLPNKPLSIEFENEKTIVGEIQQKLGKLKSSINIKNAKPKQIKRSDLENAIEQARPDEIESSSPYTTNDNKTMNNADDTNALLDMLSHFTDTTRVCKDFTSEDNEEVAPIEFNGHIAIEDKTGGNEVRRSAVPDRRSMIRSREDLLRDISMAQALMQRSEDSTDESGEHSPEPRASPGHARLEVVKTLHFDDDESLRRESDTPLKKTAFGETTYMHDSKTRVIPEYMSYASDLKDLMRDLVKPLADGPRAGAPPAPRRSASTCSTQIQANLLTSSQIDLAPDRDSSGSERAPSELGASIADVGDEAIAHALRDEMVHSDSFHPSDVEAKLLAEYEPARPRRSAGRVIVFDHHNPLNNVLLPAPDAGEVHGYDPRVSATSVRAEPSDAGRAAEAGGPRRGECRVALHSVVLPAGDASPPPAARRKPRSVDRGVNAACLELKDSEANTLIVMKRNNELLDASSSLTLVDDALHDAGRADSGPSSPKDRSPVRVIFKVKDESSLKLDTDLTSVDDEMFLAQAKKRVYSPASRDQKHCTFAHDVTPRPASKVQRVSNGPWGRRSSLARSPLRPTKATEVVPETERTRAPAVDDPASDDTSSQDAPAELAPSRRRSRGSKLQTPETAVTIHHLITEYDMDASMDQTTLTKQILAVLEGGRSAHSLSTAAPPTEPSSSAGSRPPGSESGASSLSRAGWQPELLHEMSSKNLVAECDSSVNVVAKIDVLPFMGSSECEWEARGADAWAVRLMRGRLRLLVRLEHRHDNAPRTRVRADTPVRGVCVQPVADHSTDDPIAALCVQFACAAMQHWAARCARAGDAPALLRRCAGVARVAVRWARAMHAARAHLAYTLAQDGALSLKVANIPLRSVWEVTLRVREARGADEAPWPRAADVRVARVVSEVGVPAEELARLLAPVPGDWGHAPRTIWKIFKYLKRKTRDDDLLII